MAVTERKIWKENAAEAEVEVEKEQTDEKKKIKLGGKTFKVRPREDNWWRQTRK